LQGSGGRTGGDQNHLEIGDKVIGIHKEDDGQKANTAGVRLQQSFIGHTDKYRRILAYVYLIDGTFLNAEVIKQGYRFAHARFPSKYMEDFRRYKGNEGK
jgi:hypothetical protein